ncbi:unnamed protein product [Leptidea sinapis]|uniref:Uncharacterized protein n=1 Tax=Leptidea sinapis TaxID=189913 RepID=A0A5E4QXP1_9NEOP|nr:unnamed protein product [Leptidea sinapis]
MVEPVFGVLGAVAVAAAQPALPYALAFAAGAMIYVVADDIIPEANASGHFGRDPRTNEFRSSDCVVSQESGVPQRWKWKVGDLGLHHRLLGHDVSRRRAWLENLAPSPSHTTHTLATYLHTASVQHIV